MSGLVIALIAVGSTLGYTIGCGITYAIGKERGWNYGADPAPFFACALWPLVLPGMLSASATRALIAGRKQKQLPEARPIAALPEAREVRR